MLLAVGLWTACSDTNDVIEDVNVENPTDAEGFISMNVILPSSVSPGTREGQGKPNNDDFDHGSEDEYAVGNVTVVVFDGNGEDAVAQVVIKPTLVFSSDNQTANITMSSTEFLNKKDAIEVETDPTRYILVIANHNGQLNPQIGNSYGDIKKALVGKARDDFKTEGFFMSNSPIVLTKDGVSSVQTLVPCIPQTTAAAAQLPGNYADVYLERILGKVEVKSNLDTDGSWVYNVPKENLIAGGDVVTFLTWGLDVTNTTTYPVRQVDEEWITYSNDGQGTATTLMSTATGTTPKYPGNRFYGKTAGAVLDPVRIYWAIDPNYTEKGTYATLNATDMKTLGATSNIDYCLENTFDVANQIQDRTTRVVMKAQYAFAPDGGGEPVAADFYRSSKGFIFKSTAKLMGQMTIELDKKGAVTSFVLEKESDDEGAPVKKTGATILDVKYQLYATNESGELLAGEDGKPYLDGEDVGVADEELSAIQTAIGTLDFYEGGVCYYIARIHHFGDPLTPWDSSTTYAPGTTSTHIKDYLGRYGVVRNNWYVLTINKADKGPGEPEIPTPGGGQDDTQTYYIDAKSHILSWAQRYQGVDW